uniref:F-box domain-containing protein n=1 Tax=Meloidogyne incognita TaxID=6306 RepID=A0A914NQ39_MELIC
MFSKEGECQSCKSKTNVLPSPELWIPIINLCPTKTKIKTFLPAELTSEIINFIPYNEKWAVTRISRLFDYFVFKLQKIWIIKLRIARTQCIASFTQIKDDFTRLKAPACAANLYVHHLTIFTYGFKNIYLLLQGHTDDLRGLNALLNDVQGWPKVDVYTGAKNLRNDYVTKVEILAPLFESIFNMLNDSAWNFLDYFLWNFFGK